MTMADIAGFIHGDPVMGTFFLICAVIFGLAFLALPIGIIWGVTKSGRTAMFAAAVYLGVQGVIAYTKFPDKGGHLLALGFGAAGVILFLIALNHRNKPELTREEAEELTSRETRSIPHSKSGKFIALLTAATCFAVVWTLKNDRGAADAAGLMLGFFVAGCGGVLSFLFPSQAAAVFEAIGKFLPGRFRRRY